MKSYFCQRSPSGHVGFLLFCLAMAVLAVLSWPMLPLASGHETHVKIEATGIRDPAGKSSEVWITQMPAGVDAGCLAENSVGASGQRGAGAWERRGTILVSYKDQPAVAECDVVADPEGTFRFGTHALSGEVILTVNGVSRKMQLYSLQPGGVNVSLSEFPQGKIGQRGCTVACGHIARRDLVPPRGGDVRGKARHHGRRRPVTSVTPDLCNRAGWNMAGPDVSRLGCRVGTIA